MNTTRKITKQEKAHILKMVEAAIDKKPLERKSAVTGKWEPFNWDRQENDFREFFRVKEGKADA